jgi:tRNA threonylcarbamoyladenosine biosynthesis protein TsaB
MLPSPLLMLEASTSAGSVALFVEGVLIAERDVVMGPSREDAMLPAIADVLQDAGMRAGQLRAIACGSGPGSFTSLRIAAALAKGLAVANDVLLFAVPSLLLAVSPLAGRPGDYLLHADALRGERYMLRVRVGQNGSIDSAGVTTRMSLADVMLLAAREGAVAMAISAMAISGVATDASLEDASPELTLQPHARNVAALVSQWSRFGPVSVAVWEPGYGRLAEAQVKWETAHGQTLPSA